MREGKPFMSHSQVLNTQITALRYGKYLAECAVAGRQGQMIRPTFGLSSHTPVVVGGAICAMK